MIGLRLAPLFVFTAMSLCAAEPPAPAKAAAERANEFAFDFLKRCHDDGTNFTFSPYSIRSAFSVLTPGAAGETLKELQKTLKFPEVDALAAEELALREALIASANANRIDITAVNSLWVRKGLPLMQPFVQKATGPFGADIMQVDFHKNPADAAVRINRWVSHHTEGMIPEMIVPRDVVDADLAIVNAMYFQGKWASPFKVKATQPRPFHPAKGGRKLVPMMSQTLGTLYHETLTAQWLELDYRNDGWSMIIGLPRTRDGLPALERSLDAKSWSALLGQIKGANVAVKLPRQKLSAQFDLIGALRKLGLNLPFKVPGADFHLIAGMPELYVQRAKHAAVVEIDEEGTRAAAATMAAAGFLGKPPRPKSFIADRPFLFLIREKSTGLILFIGRVNDVTPPAG